MMQGGIWSALLTPFDAEGRIMAEQAEALISFYQRQRADGLYLLGFTGEGEFMTREQRMTWAEAALAAGKGKLPLYVHVGYSSDPANGIALAEHAGRIGADAVSSVGLSRGAKLAENIAYFRAVSEASGLPFYVYWNAFGGNLNGGERLDPPQLLDALRTVPTFAGFKYTDSNFYYLDRIKKYAPEAVVYTGVDQMCIAGRLMGSDGAIGALQSVTCEHMKVMWEKYHAGDVAGAMALQVRANNIYEALDAPDIGSLIPAMKLVMKEHYGVDVGVPCAAAPFKAIADPAIAERVLRLFRQNIYQA